MNRVYMSIIVVCISSFASAALPLNPSFSREAVLTYKEKADAGDAEAQYLYSLALRYGGVVVSDMEAFNKYDGNAAAQKFALANGYPAVDQVRWAAAAAAQNDAWAQYQLGICYDFGRGVKENKVEAAKWYRKAAEQGHVLAQVAIGQCYFAGNGVGKNEIEAVEWYRKAAEQGYLKAMEYLGHFYRSGLAGVQKDMTEAVKWYRKAAEQGHILSSLALAHLYEQGNGIAKDMQEAVKWYKQAAIGGNEQAVDSLRNAANKGDAYAQFVFGELNENGYGVKKDEDEAMKWYRLAAEAGNKQAIDRLSDAIDRLRDRAASVAKKDVALSEIVDKAVRIINEDPFGAVDLLKEAIAKGGVKAKIYLGRCYMKGDGVEKDRAKGLKLRVEAARAGYSQEYMELAKEAEKLGEAIIWYRLAMDAGLELGKNMLMWNLEVFLTERGEYENRVYKSGKDEFGGAGAYKSEWKVSKEFCYRYFSEVVAKGASQYTKAFLGYCSYMMGRYTENGWACEPDKITALRWYYRAQAYGNEKAVRSGARLEENFSKSTVDAIKKKEGLYDLCKKPEDIEKDAIEAGKTTFALRGFYLGMSISDAKIMVEKYLPESRVVIMEDGSIEIDVTHKAGDAFDVTPMVFCKADDKGKVVRFNFDARFLKQWFKYDAQDYSDWAMHYGKEFFPLNVDRVEESRDLGDVCIAVSQEAYRYRDNKKKFVVSYFGKKTVFDPNGEQSFDDMLSNPNRAGRIEGVRAWVKNGWENGDGAREGTLRVEMLK